MERSNIEEMIDEIIELVEECKSVPLSTGKISVPKETLLQKLQDLRMEVPGEIAEAQDVLDREKDIVAEAQERADQIIKNAADEAAKMIEESEVVEMAKYRAEEIMEETRAISDKHIKAAKAEASNIQIHAMEYTNDMMAGLSGMFANIHDNEKQLFESVLSNFKQNEETVERNRKEIEDQLNRMKKIASGQPLTRTKEDF